MSSTRKPTQHPSTPEDLRLELRLTPVSPDHAWRATLESTLFGQEISFETPLELAHFLARLGRLEAGTGLK
jgi:hypothetical protein